MTYIPYGEGIYKEKYLDEKDKELIKGWELATEEIETFFDNADDETITGLKTIDNIVREIDENTKQALLEWMESTRRMHVVGLIDSLPEERKEEFLKEEEESGLLDIAIVENSSDYHKGDA